MNAIIGFTELLSQHIKDDEGTEFLKSIKAAGNTLLSLINNILDLSKIESGKMKITRDFIEISPLLSDIKLIFEKQIEQKGLSHQFLLNDPFAPLLYLDEIRLKQVLINIIGNALKFTQQGTIKVDLQVVENGHENQRDFVIRVEDTGIGIPSDQHKLIFESFTQQDGKSTRKYEGTGLGLAICSKLVTLMNGRIELESQVNVGSTFKIVFENVEAMPRNIHKKPENLPEIQTNFKGQKVLIVDDIQSNRIVLGKILTRYNLSVIYAKSGKEAIDLLKSDLPALIIMDIKMPEMNGIETAQIITSQPHFSEIPIIALSASMKNDHNIASLEIFKSFLSKPFITEEIIHELKKYLDYHEILTERKSGTEENTEQERPSELIQFHSENYLQEIQKLKENMLIDDILAFSKNIQTIGQQSKSRKIIDISNQLIAACSLFNILEISHGLDQLAILFEKKE